MKWSMVLTISPTEAIPQEETVTVSWDGSCYFCTCDSPRYRETQSCTHIQTVIDDGLHTPMDLLRAVELIENPSDDTPNEEILSAWQFMIDTGHCWELQGFYGRTAMRLIEDGICTPQGANDVEA